MDQQAREPFPCHGCGKCCRRVGHSEATAWLDRGDGTCRHFGDADNRCSIYALRPLVCRVEEYYERHLSAQVTWTEFVRINLEICGRL